MPWFLRYIRPVRNFLVSIGIGCFLINGCRAASDGEMQKKNTPMAKSTSKLEQATFAGGCFWCMEYPFETLDGVRSVTAGYTGGHADNPNYEEVSSGTTGHAEAVQITFDPGRISYSKLLDVFWRQIDPTDTGGSFADRGSQYRSAIFYHSQAQKRLAEESKKELEKSGRFDRPIVTEIVPYSGFWPAEEYHQDYSKKNPVRYKLYRDGSGRDSYLKRKWGEESSSERPEARKQSENELRKSLTPLQYDVTQQCGTERPFDNEYWDNKREGLYVDVVSGEPLFLSTDKYDSGTGWPSFTKPVRPGAVLTRKDGSFFSGGTEVRSAGADSHLGHLFGDGPGPTGQRYCINSAALKFIPKEELEEKGYGEYSKFFE